MHISTTCSFLKLLYRTLWGEERQSEEYSVLFEYTDAALNIPLWESHYRGNMALMLDETTLSLERCYAQEGLRICNPHLPGDHLGYEVAFLLYLYQKKAKETFVRFYQEHVSYLLEQVFTRIKSVAKSAYYQELASLVLQEKEHYLAAPTFGEEVGMELPFTVATPKELQAYLEEKVIASAGRNNCGSKCVIKAHREGGSITHLDSDVYDESRECMIACLRGRGYRRTFLSSDRLRYPMVRVGKRGEGKFQRISWKEALDLMEKNLREKTEKYGVGCRYVNYGCGDCGITAGRSMVKRFLSRTGGFLDYHNSYSSACQRIAAPYCYGTEVVSSTLPTFQDSKLLILWAFNPLVTEPTGQMVKILKYHKEQGTPIVVIDPRFHETAATYATMFLPIRPGTDAALAAAVAYVLYEEDLVDHAFLDTYCLGFDAEHMPEGHEEEESYQEYLYGVRDGVRKTPEWAEAITGLPASRIKEFALLYGQTKPTALIPGLGNNRVSNGEQNVRAMVALQCLTGNVGIPGGSSGARGDFEGHHGMGLPPVENPYGRSIPCFLWTDGITRGTELTEKDFLLGSDHLDSNIKVLFNIAGNVLMNQHSDLNATRRILEDETKCEFIVVSDIFMTPSARYADLLLPGTSPFEVSFITQPWGDGNFLLAGNKVIEPLFEGRDEFDWVQELARRFGVLDLVPGDGTSLSAQRSAYEDLRKIEKELPDYGTFMKEGGYVYRHNQEFVAFQREREDLKKYPFPTPSGKIEIYSPRLKAFGDSVHIPALPKYVAGFDGYEDKKREWYPLQLVGWHTKRRCHTIHDNNPWMEKVEPQVLYMNPMDAASRQIKDGDLVRVYNERGKVEVKVTLTERVMKGVAGLPQGAWYTPDEKGVDHRGSVNVLSPLTPTPIAKANAQHSILVEVERCSS